MKAELAQRFLQARTGGALLPLLHPQCRYQTRGKDLAGAEAVAAELLQGGNADLSGRLQWQPPEAAGAQVRLTGIRQPGTRDRGLVLTLSFVADRQRVFDRAPPAERAHDFAMLGVAVVVDLDRVEGYAGLGPQGQVDGIRMLRDAASQ